MPSLAGQGLVLKATEVGRCPVLRPGATIAACGREVFVPAGGSCCARLLVALNPSLETLENGGTPSFEGGVLLCAHPDCAARFAVEIVPLATLAAFRTAAPPPPPPQPPPQPPPPPPPKSSSDTAVLARIQSNLPFLGKLPTEMARMLLSSGDRLLCEAGETLLQEGAPGVAVYFLLAGHVTVEKRTPDGGTVQLAILGPGECFGEMSFLSGDPVNATIRTLEASRIVRLRDEVFDRLMAENPILHRWFSRLFAERLRNINIRLEERLIRGMTGRLSMISLPEILQTLHLSRQTGVLVLSRGAETGRIVILQGQVQGAEFAESAGEPAFYLLARWTEGSFTFLKETPPPAPIPIRRETMSLLMEAARLADEHSTPPTQE